MFLKEVWKIRLHNKIKRNSISICLVVFIFIIILDYLNIPSRIGLEVNNFNTDFLMGLFNIVIVVLLFAITYSKLDKRTIKREENKKDIAIFLVMQTYEQCKSYIDILTPEVVEEYIVPKIDFNSTDRTIEKKLEQGPFENDSVILDLVKDGQVDKSTIEAYYKIKGMYGRFITLRICAFDKREAYWPIEDTLRRELDREIKRLKISR